MALLIAGCVTPYNPFKVSQAELRRRVRTIALYPLVTNADLVNPDEARALIEPLIARQLAAGGFKVVGSEEVARMRGEAAKSVGELYDPKTGEMNEANSKVVDAAVHRELALKDHVDAILYTSITLVEIEELHGQHFYCGDQGPPYWPTQLPRGEHPTRAMAACFNTVLEDAEERDLYSIRSGIIPTETYALQTHAKRPAGAVLKHVPQLKAAIKDTLGPLTGQK